MSFSTKPLKIMHSYFIIMFLPILIPFNMGLLFEPNLQDYPWQTLLVMDTIAVTAYILMRVCCSTRYEIDENGIVGYDGKRVILKLKREEIEKIYIQKGKWYDLILWLLHAFNGNLTPCGTFISFCFVECEICRERATHVQRKKLKAPEDYYRPLKEYPELFTYSQCKKICKILNIKPIYVKSDFWKSFTQD